MYAPKIPVCLRHSKMSCRMQFVLFRPHQLHSKASCSPSSLSTLKYPTRSLVMLCLASSYTFATTFVATERLFEALVRTSFDFFKESRYMKATEKMVCSNRDGWRREWDVKQSEKWRERKARHSWLYDWSTCTTALNTFTAHHQCFTTLINVEKWQSSLLRK